MDPHGKRGIECEHPRLGGVGSRGPEQHSPTWPAFTAWERWCVGVSDRSGFGPVQSALRTRPPVQFGAEGLATLESATLYPATKPNHPVGARAAGARE